MPNDLSIQTVPQANTGSGSAAPVRPAATTAPVGPAAPANTVSPNPTLALNAALGLVVIEFRNAAGSVVSSIPTAQQIHAYQAWQVSGIGRRPNIGVSTPAPAIVPAAVPVPARTATPVPTPAPIPAPTGASTASAGSSHSAYRGVAA
jgi:hypothetical protein